MVPRFVHDLIFSNILRGQILTRINEKVIATPSLENSATPPERNSALYDFRIDSDFIRKFYDGDANIR